MKYFLFLLFILSSLPMASQENKLLTAESILDKVQANQNFPTARLEGQIRVQDQWGLRVSGFISWSRGTSDSLLEITSGEDRGQKILRTKNELYVFYPSSERALRIQGAALADSVMDSDLSFEDISGDKDFRGRYVSRLIGETLLENQPVYQLELTSQGANVAYPRQELWVSTQDFVILQARYYALSGRLLKEMRVTETLSSGGRILPKVTQLEDKLKEGSLTEMILSKVQIGITLRPSHFSLENLTW